MRLLIILAGIGVFFSVVIHILTMLNLFQPTDAIAITQNVIIGVLFLTICIIIKKTSCGIEKGGVNRQFDALFKGREIAVFIVFILSVYGVAIFSMFLYKTFKIAWSPSGTVKMVHITFHKSFSALVMTFYIVEYFVLYSSKVLKESFVKRCRCGQANSVFASHCEICGLKSRNQTVFELEKSK